MRKLSSASRRMPGQPLIALLAIPMVWAMLRIASGEFGFPAALPPAATVARAAVPIAGKRQNTLPLSMGADLGARYIPTPEHGRGARYSSLVGANLKRPRGIVRSMGSRLLGPANIVDIGEAARQDFISARVAKPATSPAQPMKRWEGDAWLVLREGSERSQLFGASLPVYGGSQAGAIVRFALIPGSTRRPVAYLRAVHALESRESDIAMGLSARPLPGLPVTAHVEARASRRGEEVDIRPAAFLTVGIDESPLPFGARARGYAQAGYVGGRGATAFADGSMVAEREVLRRGDSSFGIGGGVWGGAQRGANRLDLGPSASLRFKLGEGYGRVAIDYRIRVAGNAAPAAGAALTLSAGF